MAFGGAGGSLYFKAGKSQTFDPDEIIAFAEKNNWLFQSKAELTKSDFAKFLDEKGHVIWLDIESYFSCFDDDENYNQGKKMYEQDKKKSDLLREMTMFPGGFTMWIQQDCTVLSFDTGNRIGMSSHVAINRDGTEMAVYYNGGR